MPRGCIDLRRATFVPVVFVTVVLPLVAGCAGSGGTDHAGMMQAGPGMMGYVPGNEAGPVRSLAAARRQADRFGDALGLRAGEVMQFSNGFYAELLDADATQATEVLIDPSSGAVWIEYGPAMMWNTRYGMMGSYSFREGRGMMGAGAIMTHGPSLRGGLGMRGSRFRGDPTWTPRAGTQKSVITRGVARRIASHWLEKNADGLTTGEADAFPGYFTLHTLRAGNVAGMLSVNAYTGAVWYHWWHGRFIAMEE